MFAIEEFLAAVLLTEEEKLEFLGEFEFAETDDKERIGVWNWPVFLLQISLGFEGLSIYDIYELFGISIMKKFLIQREIFKLFMVVRLLCVKFTQIYSNDPRFWWSVILGY